MPPACPFVSRTLIPDPRIQRLQNCTKKREILGPRNEKVITGVRLGRSQVRVPHKKMGELRAAIHRLAVKSVGADDLGKYRQNLAARIAYADWIHSGDAAKLRRQAAKSGVFLK
jgi:hypothetical protein